MGDIRIHAKKYRKFAKYRIFDLQNEIYLSFERIFLFRYTRRYNDVAAFLTNDQVSLITCHGSIGYAYS